MVRERQLEYMRSGAGLREPNWGRETFEDGGGESEIESDKVAS